MSEGIRPVCLLEIDFGAVAHRAMWGYGVGPPADINPHLDLAIARVSPHAAGDCSRRPWLCAPVPAPRLTGRFSGGRSWPLRPGCVIRTAQVTGPF